MPKRFRTSPDVKNEIDFRRFEKVYRMTRTIFTPFAILLLLTSIHYNTFAQIKWPKGQLLPSFPASASHQDLFFLREIPTQWQAENSRLPHATGRRESDGWICQLGVDTPRRYMVSSPQNISIPAGPNIAEFRLKLDGTNNSDDSVVTLDVRNVTSGATLALKTITRKQVETTGEYVNISLPFEVPANAQPVELRVYWHGTVNTKVDWVRVQQNNSTEEMYLFSSLKGVVNKKKPRLCSYEGDASGEGPYTWLQSLGLTYTEYADKWQLITKYRSELAGLVVYDPEQIHTVNLATMLAGSRKALISSPALAAKLTKAPYNLPILVDLRGKFRNKLEVYENVFDNYWKQTDQRILIGLNPEAHKAALREYATALGSTVIWLDPKKPGESELLNKFLSSMPEGGNFMGWWPEEQPGVERASSYGIATIASDFATNLTMHSGMPRKIVTRPAPPKPALKNKIYVGFILSDGDNLQYVEHMMRKTWNNPDRGSVPIGWTVSPAMLDAMPGALNYYYRSATDNDNLISGPSGYGYAYPNLWPSQKKLAEFVSKTENYNARAGLRVITIWNTITGGIDTSVGKTFSNHAPTLLGLTAQNTGGGLTIYNNSLPGLALSCNYCTSEKAMREHIAKASAGWDRSTPRFLLIQAQPWTNMKPTNFKNVADSLNDDYIVVRPDHLFQLLREAQKIKTVTTGTRAESNFSNPASKNNKAPVASHVNSDKLFITGVKNGSEANVYDLAGRIVLAKPGLSAGNSTIDISSLRPATYFIKIIGEEARVLKFVKPREL